MNTMSIICLILSAMHLFVYILFMCEIDIDNNEFVTYSVLAIMIASPVFSIIISALQLQR
jgi:hypothetical protein